MLGIDEKIEVLYGLTKHLEKGIVLNQEMIATLIKSLIAHRDILVSLICKVHGLDEEEAKNFLKIDLDKLVDDK